MGARQKKKIMLRKMDLEQPDSETEQMLIDKILAGQAVPIMFGEVYALVADARDPKAEKRTRQIKNRSIEKPFGILADAETSTRLVDLDRVHQDFHHLFEPTKIKKHFGAKGFIRFPLHQDYMRHLAPGVYSLVDMTIQTFTFEGDEAAFRMEEKIRQALKKKHPGGHGEILITSFNISGQPSIVDHDEAEQLAQEKELEIVVRRYSSKKGGSYSIYRVERTMEKIRHGSGSAEIDVEFGLG